MSLSAAAVMSAVDHATTQLPDLRIVVTPDCRGHDWVTIPGTCTVYVAADTSPDQCAAWLLDALDDLCLYHQVPAPRGLRLVHSQPTRGRPDTLTAT